MTPEDFKKSISIGDRFIRPSHDTPSKFHLFSIKKIFDDKCELFYEGDSCGNKNYFHYERDIAKIRQFMRL